MGRLLGVELARFRWRRAVKVLLAACIVAPLLLLSGTAWSTRPVSEAELAQAQATAEREAQQPYVQDGIEQCLEDPDSWLGPGGGGDDPEAACIEANTPRAEWFLNRQPLDVASAVNDLGVAVPTILSVLLLLAAATYVGADWASGSMSNQLLFEPRRGRVWAAKALVLVVVGAVVGAVVQTLFWLGIGALASSRDLEVAGSVWDPLPGIVFRGTLLMVGAALLGYSLTMLFRSTVVTLGILFGTAVASTILIMTLPLGGDNERYILPTNVSAFVMNGTDYYDSGGGSYTCTTDENGMQVCEDDGQRHLSLAGGAAYLGLLLLLPGAAGLGTFRRRDVP
jgi:ABC-2 type transport system permease protein